MTCLYPKYLFLWPAGASSQAKSLSKACGPCTSTGFASFVYSENAVSCDAGVQAPASVTLPFGTFERVLAHESNKGVASAVAKAQKELVSGPKTASSLRLNAHAGELQLLAVLLSQPWGADLRH